MDDLEIADYEILLRVFRRWNPEIPRPEHETPEQYKVRMEETVIQRELKAQFRAVLRKLRKAIVGE